MPESRIKRSSSGAGLVYSTFLGGYGSYAYATAIAVDGAGRAYIAGNEEEICSTGYTFQSCFPTTSGAVIGGTKLADARPNTPSSRRSIPPAPTCSIPLSSAT